ncbi:unnamed protein product [Boreogadus saida]
MDCRPISILWRRGVRRRCVQSAAKDPEGVQTIAAVNRPLVAIIAAKLPTVSGATPLETYLAEFKLAEWQNGWGAGEGGRPRHPGFGRDGSAPEKGVREMAVGWVRIGPTQHSFGPLQNRNLVGALIELVPDHTR